MISLALQAVNGLTAGVALLTQLLEATVLLMLLDKLAAAIRFTYQAGRFTGRLWYQYGVPAVLWLADTVSWLLAQIDWAAVLQTVVRTGCAAVAAFQVDALQVDRLARRHTSASACSASCSQSAVCRGRGHGGRLQRPHAPGRSRCPQGPHKTPSNRLHSSPVKKLNTKN